MVIISERVEPKIHRQAGDRFYAVLPRLLWDSKRVVEVGSQDWTEAHYEVLDQVVLDTYTSFGTSHAYFTLEKSGRPRQKMLHLSTNVPGAEVAVWSKFRQSCVERGLSVPANVADASSD